ncbi:23S rRNA (pseudouridine(1915)-N(3))-methyltransferase RlmH [Virgibacillus sp. MSJ-26]|uniref:23S rRNA (pseudouridine(1915)-N(3))-methyltransferase RlmH n=1 Tax=Virgibacillus sp. MSJ-26 TaxID=2841522 RepID=UPI001C10047A|nr:23S rRNA (pseudouridine(1915)-N(3))-methyltransferase RlmH [Virgibacillus sp. MSJ-26]MBU5467511.1 23S rRNA (pseudouridine(1915)-N(3))-methyltransferase RlmH [Virgibacillus sp. MSJ-26]
MNITIISVGKLKEKFMRQAVDEYMKRLTAYAKVNIIEVPNEKAPENLSHAQAEAIKQKEGDRILKHINDNTYVITLEIDGKMLTSEQLSKKIGDLSLYGQSRVAFVIGGSLGISDGIKQRSNMALSFSKMTFPHQLMRVVLLEQVYRAFKIMRGEPYHK